MIDLGNCRTSESKDEPNMRDSIREGTDIDATGEGKCYRALYCGAVAAMPR
jgi:hypothetical protein